MKSQTSRRLLITTFITLLALTQLATASKPNDEINFLFEVTNVGAKGPKYNVQRLPWVIDYYKEELTPSGQRQHYYLGYNTNQRYKTFFQNSGKPFNENQFYIRAAATNQTMSAAYSQAFGVLGMQFNTNLPFGNSDQRINPPFTFAYNPNSIPFTTPLPNKIKSFPVHSRLDPNKDLLFAAREACPSVYASMQAQRANALSYVGSSTALKSFVNRMLAKYGLPSNWESGLTLLERCSAIGDFAIQDLHNNANPTLNPTASAQNRADLNLLTRCVSYDELSWFKNGITNARVLGSALVGQVQAWFDEKNGHLVSQDPKKLGKNGLNKERQYLLFNGHDSTLVALLHSRGILNNDCLAKDLINGKASSTSTCPNTPPLASNLVFELVTKRNTGNRVVKVSLNGAYIDYCGNGQKDEYGEYYCAYTTWNNFVLGQVIYPGYADKCGTTMAEIHRGTGIEHEEEEIKEKKVACADEAVATVKKTGFEFDYVYVSALVFLSALVVVLGVRLASVKKRNSELANNIENYKVMN